MRLLGLLKLFKIEYNDGLRKQILGLWRCSVGKDLNLNPRHLHETPVKATDSCNPGTAGQRAADFEGLLASLLSPSSTLWFKDRPHLKGLKQRAIKMPCSTLHTGTYLHIHMRPPSHVFNAKSLAANQKEARFLIC